MANKVISLDLNTKIQYSLFNFFAPVSLVAICISSFECFSFKATLFAFLSILIGLYCLIRNLIEYNRCIVIHNGSIIICTGRKNPKILNTIKSDELKVEKIEPNFYIKHNGKRTKLLNLNPSILGLICWVGPIIIIPLLKRNNLMNDKLFEVKTMLPEIVSENVSQTNKTSNTLANVLMWGFVLFVSVTGCIGILLAPFYAFMK